MIVNDPDLIGSLVDWWSSRRSSTQARRVAARVEPVFSAMTPQTPRLDTPVMPTAKVSDTDQSSFPAGEVDPMYFRVDPEPPQPTPPSRPRKRSARTEKAAKWIRKEVRRSGHLPPFTLIVNKTKLPKATASRLRREIMIEMMAA